ncbi:HPr-rel-A system PqqD family peptide chaperone [Noviherbaspirillum sedimenti]|uniref:HPr-rel-A system PqqD family peptide chaperone n=1 Tax=Noviherbaspirillum sedimenti TaxID=2320865 RepID=A0A3A3GLL7_9BURK|nr:HPr-rel-A system PqqD family peptide chaperone [Noviherbaspirillum sedimenti]RJG01870.1 HPr-rel-A system PqqD family peptide chaperone [Noviherbaspirillum sedimenti]
MKWQAISPQSLHTRTWDDEVVVYDALSGNTHLLGLAAARLLAAIAQAPGDIAALAHTLEQHWPDLTAEEAHTHVDAMLAELAGIGLIAAVSP